MSGVGFGDQEDAAGEAVEAVDDAGAEVAADAGERVEAVEQGVDQGAGVDAGAGVDHHAGGLIDGDDGGVFVEDAERDVFGSGVERWEVGGLEIDEVAGVEGLGGAGGRAIDESAAGFDPILDSGAAVLWELGRGGSGRGGGRQNRARR